MLQKNIFILVAVLFFAACNNEVDDKLEEMMIKTLEANNQQLNEDGKVIFYDIEYKLRRAETEERAFHFVPKAVVADSLLLNLDSTLNEIQSQKIGEVELKKLLTDFRNTILKLDDRFEKYVQDNSNNDSLKKFNNNFSVEAYYKNTSLSVALTKNKATLLRNYFLNWCLNMLTGCDYITYSFSAIASQNSTRFNQNEELIITAGVGAFNKNILATIMVDKDTVPTNRDGVAEYKLNVGNKKGTFTKKVSIIYFRPNGEKQDVKKEIEYTVD